MRADAEVDLGDALGSESLGEIDEHRDLHAPPLDEWQLGENAPAPGDLARERLLQPRQLGHVQREQGPRDELRGPAAATVVARTVVAGLHEGDRLVVEQRRKEAGDPHGLERGHVGVAPHHEVAGADGQRGPQRIALAVADAVALVDVTDRDDPRSGAGGHDR